MTKLLKMDAYPCYWPDGWDRTPSHRRQASKYQTSFVRSRDDIVRQLKLMGATEVVMSTNIPLRKDGLPLAGMSSPDDPAVAVYWVERGKYNAQSGNYDYQQRVIACDHWRKVEENMRAVCLAIEALRTLKRTGATQVTERAFMGFNALAANNNARSWREVLGFEDSERVSRTAVTTRYRELAWLRHPDHGGSNDAMSELNAAHAAALREVAA